MFFIAKPGANTKTEGANKLSLKLSKYLILIVSTENVISDVTHYIKYPEK